MEVVNINADRSPLAGFRYYHLIFLSLLSGVLFTATLPVRGIPLLDFVAFVPLLLLEDHIHRNRSRYRWGAFFVLVYMAFLLWNLAGSWWLKNASIGGALLAVFVNALLMTWVFQIFHACRKVFRNEKLTWILFIIFWLGFEYFHHNWDLTYPWFSLGNAFSSWPAWVQWYEYTGMPGGSFWILTGNVMAFLAVAELLKTGRVQGRVTRRILIFLGWFIIPSLCSLWIYHTYKNKGEVLEVVLVQPNHDPYKDQYNIGALTAIGNFLTLAEPLTDRKTAFVIGPESMIQENIWEGYMDYSTSIDSLKSWIARHPRTTLIVGASSFRMLLKDDPITVSARQVSPDYLSYHASTYGMPLEKLSGWFDAYNLGFALDTGGITGMTHKSKLVAGVERMPFKKYLEPLLGEVAMNMGGTVGTLAIDDERFVFTHNPSGYRYGVAICYESVFGEFFGDFVRNGADMMFIITNDGWWGNTPGHRQHNAFASLRAIETRRDIARSANTGITCFISQRGEILQPTIYWTPDAIKGEIHTNDKITFYVRYGDYIGKAALLLSVILLLIGISYRLVPLHRRKSR